MQPTPLSRWGSNRFSIQPKPRTSGVGATNYFFSTSVKQEAPVSTLKKFQLWLWGVPPLKKSALNSMTWQQQAVYLGGLALVVGSALIVRHKAKNPSSPTPSSTPGPVINKPKPVVINQFDLLKTALSGDAKTAQKALDDMAKHISSTTELNMLITLALKHPKGTVAEETIKKIASLIPATESAMRQELYLLGVQHHDNAVSRQAATEIAKDFPSPKEVLAFVQALPIKEQLSFTADLEAKEQYLVIEKGLKDHDSIARCRAMEQIEKLNLLNQNAIKNQLNHLAANESNPAVAAALLENMDKISFSAGVPTLAETRALNTFMDGVMNSVFQNKHITSAMVKKCMIPLATIKECPKVRVRIRDIVDTDFENQPAGLKELAAKYFTALPSSEKTLARWDVVREQRAEWGENHTDSVKDELKNMATATANTLTNYLKTQDPSISYQTLLDEDSKNALRGLMASDPVREIKPTIYINQRGIVFLDSSSMPIYSFDPTAENPNLRWNPDNNDRLIARRNRAVGRFLREEYDGLFDFEYGSPYSKDTHEVFGGRSFLMPGYLP